MEQDKKEQRIWKFYQNKQIHVYIYLNQEKYSHMANANANKQFKENTFQII